MRCVHEKANYTGIQWRFLREVKLHKPLSTKPHALEAPNYDYEKPNVDEIDKLIALCQKSPPVLADLSGNTQKFHMVQSIMKEVQTESNAFYRSKLLGQEPNPNRLSVAERLDIARSEPVQAVKEDDQSLRPPSPTIFWRPTERVQLAKEIPRELYSEYRDSKEDGPYRRATKRYRVLNISRPSVIKKNKKKLPLRRDRVVLSGFKAPKISDYGNCESADYERILEISGLFISREFKKHIEQTGHRCPSYLKHVELGEAK